MKIIDTIYKSATGSINGLPAIPEHRFMELSNNIEKQQIPKKGIHKTLGEIEICGIRTKCLSNNNLMYMTIIDDDVLWVYDYETIIVE